MKCPACGKRMARRTMGWLCAGHGGCGKRIDDRPDPRPLQTAFENLLSAVWAAEAEWRLDDRIDLALKVRRPTRTDRE